MLIAQFLFRAIPMFIGIGIATLLLNQGWVYFLVWWIGALAFMYLVAPAFFGLMDRYWPNKNKGEEE